MKRNRTDIAAYIFFALLAATFLELLLAVGPFIVMVGSAAMIYYGLKRMDRKKGKWLFYSGLVFFLLALLSSTFFMLTLFGSLFYSMYLFWEKARKPHMFNVKIDDDAIPEKATFRKAFFFRNIIFGDQRAEEQVFSSDNINIQTGIGTTNIHFENTVLPKGDTVVIIRGFIGRIQLYVPYDAGVSVEHSTFFGHSDVFDQEKTGFNQNIIVTNNQYEDAPRRLRIYTSLVAGDIEVMYR